MPRSVSQWIVAVLAVILIAGSPYGGARRIGREESASDFERYYRSGEAVLDGESLYNDVKGGESEHSVRYPPTFHLLMVPFAAFGRILDGVIWSGQQWAAGLFALINTLAFFVALRLAAQVIGGFDSWRRSTSLYLVTLIFVLMFVLGGMFLGQVNALVLLGITACYALFVRRMETWSGACLAAAALVKVTPAALLPWFFIRAIRGGRIELIRALKVALGAALASLVLAVILPTLCLGPRRALDETLTYATLMRDTMGRPVLEGTSWRFNNQSLSGVGMRYRYLFFVDEEGGAVGDRYGRLRAMHETREEEFAAFADAWVRPRQFLGLLTLLLTVAGNLGRYPRGALMEGVGFSTFILLMLLLSPITWTHHFIHLMIPVMVAWTYVLRPSEGRDPMRRVLGVALALVALLELSIVWKEARILGDLFWAATLLWLVLLAVGLFGKPRWTPPLLTLDPDTPPEGTPEMRRLGTAGPKV